MMQKIQIMKFFHEIVLSVLNAHAPLKKEAP